MNRTLAIVLVAILLVAAVASAVVARQPTPLPAQSSNPSSPTGTPILYVPSTAQASGGSGGAGGGAMVPLTELNSYGVAGEDGQVVGTIDNFLLDLDQMQIAYVLLSLGQGASASDRLYPVPPDTLRLERQQRNFVFTGSTDRFNSAPYISRSDLSSEGEAQVSADVRPFWAAGNTAEQAGTPAADDSQAYVLGAQLVGFPVWNKPDERLGTIQDALIDLNGGQIAYAVIATGDALQPDKRLVPVPATALAYDAGNKAFLFGADQAALEAAPSFDQAQWPDLSQPEWDADVKAYWSGQNLVRPTTQ